MSASLTEPMTEALARTPEAPAARARARERPRASASVELRARLRGVGMWTPSYASFADWVAAGTPEAIVGEPTSGIRNKDARPPATMLHPRLRRRTSTLTRAAVTAIEAALGDSGASLDALRFVLVSSFGEIETTVALLEQLAVPRGPVSPTKFHNSVHNTATGYLSIASGNSREATALAGGPHNLEIGLLETLAGFVDTAGEAMLIFAEERLPAPFERPDADPTFAVALHLSCELEPAPGSDLGSDLGLELCLASAQDGPPASVVAPGVDGVGLPTMVSPLVALLRRVAGFGAGAGGSREPLALVAGSDPSVESAWTVTLARR